MAKRWYIIQALSNFENKVADAIREQAKYRHLDHLFKEIIVLTEKLVEVRHGQKYATERKFFPGYVLAKMELTDEAYHLIKNTPKVTDFLGSPKWAIRFAYQTARSFRLTLLLKGSTMLDRG
jgi:transcription termination/antitermination protein NusG